MVLFGQNGCIRAMLLYLGKVVVFGKKVVAFRKNRCIGAKLVVFGQIGFIRVKWVYSGIVVVFEQSGCIQA